MCQVLVSLPFKSFPRWQCLLAIEKFLIAKKPVLISWDWNDEWQLSMALAHCIHSLCKFYLQPSVLLSSNAQQVAHVLHYCLRNYTYICMFYVCFVCLCYILIYACNVSLECFLICTLLPASLFIIKVLVVDSNWSVKGTEICYAHISQ